MAPNSCWKKDDLYKELGNVEEKGVQCNDRNFHTDIKISDPKSINSVFQLWLK